MYDKPVNILMIEDSVAQASFIQHMLNLESSEQYNICWAKTFAGGVEQLSRNVPDIILLDLMLPDSVGLNTFIKANKIAPNLPIIVLSGLDDETLAIRAVQKGAQDYIVKGNVNSNKLNQAIFYAIERKKTESALRESQKRYKELANALPQTVFELDLTGKIKFVNRNALDTLGYSQEEVNKGLNILKVIAPEDYRKAKSNILNVLKYKKNSDAEYLIRQKQGTTFPARIYSSPIIEHEKITGIRGILVDISESKRIEAALEQAKEAAETANRSKSEFLANMSHEIRTPMNGIIGMTELALDTDLSPKQNEYLEIVKHSADSLLDLLNDILDFSKIEAGKLELEETDFNLHYLVEATISTVAIQAERKGIELLCDIKSDVPIALAGDPGRLRQIIINLMGNAIKFTENGEIMIQVQLQQQAPDDNFIELYFSVRDTGIGIPTDKVEKIFQSFSQADGTTTRKYGGTGLGLTISKQLVKMMGGKIWVESEPGKGSSFQFTVKMKPSQIVFEETIVDKNVDFHGARILIVDDNPTNCIIMHDVVSGWGFNATVVKSSEEALQELQNSDADKKPFTMALLDFQMPGISGFELAENINENPGWRDLKMIMMTSASQSGDANRCKKIGINAYLQKPIRQMDLLRTILSIIKGVPKKNKTTLKNKTNKSKVQPLKILLAEDSIVNQKVAVGLIQKWGHKVSIVNNGREALTELGKTKFDLILMDIQMPEMDGGEATQAIRNSTPPDVYDPQIPIIAMTAHAMKGDRERCLNWGMDDYISKPLNVGELQKKLEKYAQKKKITVV